MRGVASEFGRKRRAVGYRYRCDLQDLVRAIGCIDCPELEFPLASSRVLAEETPQQICVWLNLLVFVQHR